MYYTHTAVLHINPATLAGDSVAKCLAVVELRKLMFQLLTLILYRLCSLFFSASTVKTYTSSSTSDHGTLLQFFGPVFLHLIHLFLYFFLLLSHFTYHFWSIHLNSPYFCFGNLCFLSSPDLQLYSVSP